MEFLAIILVLVTIILLLIVVAIYQVKSAGMNVKDFFSFIKANDTLDKLAAFSKKYEKLSPQQQILFLHEAEEVFSAFEKVPNMLWEEDYNKYMDVLNKYKDIKLVRWKDSSK